MSQYDFGRVFFAQGRVFRAIPEESKEAVLRFLNSPLFAELSRKGWIPNTWVTDDVQLDGFAFCLEHEKLFDSQAKEWSFEMLKSAAIFTLQVDDLCHQYGYHIKDAIFSNVCFRNGQPVFLDFGSFAEGERRGTMDRCYGYQTIWSLYIYLILISKGRSMIARSMLQGGWFFERPHVFPDRGVEGIPELWKYVDREIKYIDLYVRVRWPHLKVRLFKRLTLRIIDFVNNASRLILNKPMDWNFIKQSWVYDVKVSDLEKIRNPYSESSLRYPLEQTDILNDLGDIGAKLNIQSITAIGNYAPQSLVKLPNQSTLTLISSDSVYIDCLFKRVAANGLSINPVCTNIFAVTDSKSTVSRLSADLLIVGNMLTEWRSPSNPLCEFQHRRNEYAIVDHLSQFSKKYLLLPKEHPLSEQALLLRFAPVEEIANGMLYKKH